MFKIDSETITLFFKGTILSFIGLVLFKLFYQGYITIQNILLLFLISYIGGFISLYFFKIWSIKFKYDNTENTKTKIKNILETIGFNNNYIDNNNTILYTRKTIFGWIDTIKVEYLTENECKLKGKFHYLFKISKLI